MQATRTVFRVVAAAAAVVAAAAAGPSKGRTLDNSALLRASNTVLCGTTWDRMHELPDIVYLYYIHATYVYREMKTARLPDRRMTVIYFSIFFFYRY